MIRSSFLGNGFLFWNKVMRAQSALITVFDKIIIMNTEGIRW
jgi:hypothetical protein